MEEFRNEHPSVNRDDAGNIVTLCMRIDTTGLDRYWMKAIDTTLEGEQLP
jgi:hypothetical protein